jgi:hypothetical protein
MIVFAREVFICKISTHAQEDDEMPSELARRMTFAKGEAEDLDRLPREHHDDAHLDEMRARLARGEHWMVGSVDDRIVTYTWLHGRDTFSYPSLPGCTYRLRADTAYGYDAWTPPELRGHGLRRRAFLEELHVLARMGKAWEASVFVKYQLEGARRSLGQVGLDIVPLYRTYVGPDRTLVHERLADDDAAVPA